jgi:hypothetical protein
MSKNRNSRSVRFTTMIVVVALALGALAIAGCGGTKESPGGPKGTGAPENVKYASAAVKTEVLNALKATHTFGTDFVWVVDTGKADTVLVTGPTMDTKSKAKFTSLTLTKGKDGKWAVTAAQ